MLATMWPSVRAVQAAAGASALHSHHTFQLVLAREGTLTVSLEDAEAQPRAGIMTVADVPHAVDSGGGQTLILFVEPESEAGARRRAMMDGAASLSIDDDLRRRLLSLLEETVGAEAPTDRLARWARAVLDELAGTQDPGCSMHPKVGALLRRLAGPCADEDLSLASLSQKAGLSESRFMHVFSESVGLPLRPWIRWKRLQWAAQSIVQGDSLSHAAYNAGFSDAAHMSRTFRAMFGMSPSMLQARAKSP
jgi:AraC-like DNA-binding protein